MKQMSFFDHPGVSVEETRTRLVRDVLCAYAAEQQLIGSLVGQKNADKLFATFPSMQVLLNAGVDELATAVSKKTARKLFAIFNLSKKALQNNVTRIQNDEDVFKLMRPYATADREHFWVITLNVRMQVIGIHELYKGSLDGVGCMRAAEIFRPAIVVNAHSVILVHNHPSNNCDPSPSDLKFTKEMVMAGNGLNIEVRDHIVIGREHCSIRKRAPHVFR